MLIAKIIDEVSVEMKKENSQLWHGLFIVSNIEKSELFFCASLNIYLVFDLSGTIDFEPFFIESLDKPVCLNLQQNSHIAIIEFDFFSVKNIIPNLNSNLPLLNSQWIYWLYYSLLELKNDGNLNLQSFYKLSKKLCPEGSFFETNSKSLTDSNFSKRHQRRLFKLNFGLPPTRQENVKKFMQALLFYYKFGQIDYSMYFDQAHFIKAVKKYTGFTPKSLIDKFQIY